MIAKEWLYLCLKRDLPPDKFCTFDMFGASLVARNLAGEYRVSPNVCTHRGFKVCKGTGDARHVRCPYHGQPFNFPHPYQLFESGEALFISASPNPPAGMVWPVELGDEFGNLKTYVNAPFHLWIQNTADPNHLKMVHNRTFAELFDRVEPIAYSTKENYSEYSIPVRPSVVDKYRKYFSGAKKWHEWGFTHMLFYPHVSITSFLGVFFSVETALPQEDDDAKTVVHTRFFVAPESKVPPMLRKMAMDNNRQILWEDQWIMGEWAKQYTDDASFWLPGEERIKHYLQWCKRKGLFE